MKRTKDPFGFYKIDCVCGISIPASIYPNKNISIDRTDNTASFEWVCMNCYQVYREKFEIQKPIQLEPIRDKIEP